LNFLKQGVFWQALSTRRRLQRPERAGLIRIGLGVGQVVRSTLLLLFDEHAAAGQQLHQPRDDPLQQRLQVLVGGGIGLDEYRRAVRAPVHPVLHQAMQVNVEREPL